MGINDMFSFNQPVTEIVKARTSVRTYKKLPLRSEVKQSFVEYFTNLSGPFGVPVRFEFVESDVLSKESNVKLGTYGIIKGASSFIAAAVPKADKNLEEVGYLFEKVILYATSLGLGTCWLGGTFTKGEFAKAINLKAEELLPVVTPVGYPGENRSLLESVMRLAVGAKNRKPWEELFYEDGFKKTSHRTEKMKYGVPLEMVRLGPSASNKQPWRVVVEENNCHFYLQHANGYAKVVGFDIQRIDMGIAMCHFEAAAKEMSLPGEWKVKDPGFKEVPGNMEYVLSWVD